LAVKILLERELKLIIRNPGFIIGLIFIIAFYSFIGKMTGYAVEMSVREMYTASIGIINRDSSLFAQRLVEDLNKTFGGRIYSVSSVEEGLRRYGYVLVIPENFSLIENFTNRSQVYLYQKIDKIPSTTTLSAQMSSLIAGSINNIIKDLLIKMRGYSPEVMNKSVSVYSEVLFRDRFISQGVLMSITGFSMFLAFITAFIMMMVGTFSTQLMVFEKIEKAFEMLLAQPIHRRDIVIAKLISSVVQSLLMGAAYLIGMFLMFTSMGSSAAATSSSQPFSSENYTIGFSINDLIVYTGAGAQILLLIGVILVLGMIYVGALGIIAGLMASDERSAGYVGGPIAFFFLGVGFAMMFISPPLDYTVAFISSFAVVPAIVYVITGSLLNDYMFIILPLIGVSIPPIILIIIASKIIDRDIIVTGLRIRRKMLRRT
jgi:ABC-2 type transport system permease protein